MVRDGKLSTPVFLLSNIGIKRDSLQRVRDSTPPYPQGLQSFLIISLHPTLDPGVPFELFVYSKNF